MNMYEFNQIGYSSLPKLTSAELEAAEKAIQTFLEENPARYYLMLNNELHYYTVYTWDIQGYRFDKMAAEIIDIAKSLGSIKSIEIAEDNQKVEFWINVPGNEQCSVFYLFNYEAGVVVV